MWQPRVTHSLYLIIKVVLVNNFIKIPEYPEYGINEKGEVYSFRTQKVLRTWKNNKGRVLVTFSIDGSRKHFLVSRLMGVVFKGLGSLDSSKEVDHINENPQDNKASNLQVLTKEEHLLKTYGVIKKAYCIECNKLLSKSYTKTCRECYLKNNTSGITLEEIIHWVVNYSWVRASKELGLSDNGLRKRYKSLSGKDPKLIKQDNI